MAKQIPVISTLLDKHLAAKRVAEGKREIVGGMTWRASTLGSCLKRQYLEFHVKQDPVTAPDAVSLRRFEVGHAWGTQFRNWFKEMGLNVQEEVELYDPIWDVGAHGDFIISDGDWKLGIELKSVQSRSFWYRTKKGGETTAKPEAMMQAAVYDLLYEGRYGDRIPWIVLSVSKDDLTMMQDEVQDAHRQGALARLEALNSAKNSGIAPPCTCTHELGEYGGNAWKWCPFYEGDLSDSGKRGAKPEGECCVEKATVTEELMAWL